MRSLKPSFHVFFNMSFVRVESDYKFPNKPGIYKFTNKINGKIYIGESLYMNERLSKYRSCAKINPVCLIEKALAKYGFDNFKYDIVETFPNGVSKETLVSREKFWISFFNSTDKTIGYNVLPFGKCMVGFKMSDEAKAKISKANKGRVFSTEQRKRMSEGQIGKVVTNAHFIGVPLKEEHKKKISERFLGKSKEFNYRAVLQINRETGEVVKRWKSISDAAENSGFYHRKISGIQQISRVLRGTKKSSRGFLWKYEDSKFE